MAADSAAAPERCVSLDAYRGFVMLLMMAGSTLKFASVAKALPESGIWAFLAFHQTHVEWVGCSLHDLIQPSFSFIVGVALPFSLAARLGKGILPLPLLLQAAWRSLLLLAIGLFLRSVGRPQTLFAFTDTLIQIGLGYTFLLYLGLRSVRTQWIAFWILLLGYWAAFALYPAPTADFDYVKVGVSADWFAKHGLGGFAAHWNKNSNLAWAFDLRFLNLFPQATRFEFNPGATSTLNFIPTLATMLLGLIAGGTLRSTRAAGEKLRWLCLMGTGALGLGWMMGALGICPVVKRLWTPSWVLFSGGWCLLLMAAFFAVVDHLKCRAWTFPLLVVGMNSIAAYVIAHVCNDFIRSSLLTHLGEGTFAIFGKPYAACLLGAGTLLVMWLVLLWMYRRKIFLRI